MGFDKIQLVKFLQCRVTPGEPSEHMDMCNLTTSVCFCAALPSVAHRCALLTLRRPACSQKPVVIAYAFNLRLLAVGDDSVAQVGTPATARAPALLKSSYMSSCKLHDTQGYSTATSRSRT